MKEALKIIDGIQDRFRSDLQAAIKSGDKAKIAHWQAYLSALTIAALEISEAMNK